MPAAPRAAAHAAPGDERSVILRGGPILTVDDAYPVAEAIALRGSRILAVGSATDIKRHYTPTTEIVDLDGRAVLPGFVEPHVHILASALAAADIETDAVANLVSDEPHRFAQLCAATLREFAARGCTTVYDASIGSLAGAAEHELLNALARSPDAPVRVRGAFTPPLARALDATPGGGDEHYNVVGIAIHADGTIQHHAAALTQPYTDGHPNGALHHDEHDLLALLHTWHDAGWQLVVRSCGDRAHEQVLRCFDVLAGDAPPAGLGTRSVGNGDRPAAPEERLVAGGGRSGVGGAGGAGGEPGAGGGRVGGGRNAGGESGGGGGCVGSGGDAGGGSGGGVGLASAGPLHGGVQHRIEHFTLASDEHTAHAAALGLSLSHPINDIYFWGEALRDRILGPARAARIHTLLRERDHGICTSCHGGPTVDPLLCLRTATTRLMRDNDDVLGPFQQLDLADALRTLTCNPARQVLLGDRVGVLRPGMLANLVVLDRDPRSVPPERLHELCVEETWLGGRRQLWG